MEFPTVINWTSPFPFSGLLGSILHFHSNFNRPFCEQTVEVLIVPSDLGLHGLPMFDKKDARLTWVKRVASGESDKLVNHGSLSKAIAYHTYKIWKWAIDQAIQYNCAYTFKEWFNQPNPSINAVYRAENYQHFLVQNTLGDLFKNIVGVICISAYSRQGDRVFPHFKNKSPYFFK